VASSNSFITASWVAKKGLSILHDKAKAAARANRNYEALFGKPLDGVPLGTSVQIRLPFKYTVSTGPLMSAQPLVQRTATLSLNNQNHVDVDLTSIERQLDIGSFTDQVLAPAMSQLSGKIEAQICALVTSVYQRVGTTSATVSFSTIAQARQYLTQMLCPEDIEGTLRTLLVSPIHNYDWCTNVATLYNPSEVISEQFIEAVIAAKVAGFLAFEETKLAGYTSGTYGGSTPVVKSASNPGIAGASNNFASTVTLSSTGWASGASTLNAGDVVTISGVYACDPESKTSLGRLQQFVVTATISDTSGEIDAVVSPAIILGGAYQNVCSSTGAVLANSAINGATITADASASTYQQSLAFGRDAIVFANVAMLDVSDIVKFCAEESYDGFNLRVVQDYDINSDVVKMRMDNLSGETLAYPEMAVRLIGT
jgi:hypothetical protein